MVRTSNTQSFHTQENKCMFQLFPVFVNFGWKCETLQNDEICCDEKEGRTKIENKLLFDTV